MVPGRALSKAAETASRGRMGPSPTCTQGTFPDFCRESLFSEGRSCDGQRKRSTIAPDPSQAPEKCRPVLLYPVMSSFQPPPTSSSPNQGWRGQELALTRSTLQDALIKS